MYLFEAVARLLEKQGTPLLTEYDLFIAGFRAYLSATNGEIKIARLPRTFDSSVNRRVISRLERNREIILDNDFAAGVWQVLSASPAASAEEALSIVDPFCYISHLSALQRHGLTNRAPTSLHITTLTQPLWGQKRRELVREEAPTEMLGMSFPTPHQVGYRTAVRRRPIETHRTKHPRETMEIRGTYARISTIGGTFVDTIAIPRLCGGMRHVIEIWKKHAEHWLDDIIKAVDQTNQPILSVRAGYLLDEIVGAREPRVRAWLTYAQRGGSRKLNPDKEYGSTWSDKWMIATNV